MIERMIANILKQREHKWHLKGGRKIVPDEQDVLDALDHAAKVLYDEPVGTRLEVGGLIIDKQSQGHDVYVYVGNYL